MNKKCVYCSKQISEESAIDVCEICGTGVWGPKMFKAIKDNMENAKQRGNLDQGSITH